MDEVNRADTYAVIDVGTNNILCLIARKRNHQLAILHRASSISALGKNMQKGNLTHAAIYRTKVILNDYIDYIKFFTDNIIIIGTSCSREAKNINILSTWLSQKHGLHYHIISGEEEAYYNGLANIYEFKGHKRFLLFDVGGGSTEFTLISNNRIDKFQSIKLGIRRLQNKYGNSLNKKVQFIRQSLEQLELRSDILIGIGGTVTTLAAINHGLEKYDPNIVHKSNISAEALDIIIKRIRSLSHRQISRIIPFDPFRSDIITLGALIIKEIIDKQEAANFYVSDRGLQFGILQQEIKTLKKYLPDN
ncbi:MAG: hypothetical protein JXB60_03425 [Candidatus Cloacimonetes bacterium]|nr:hypothetical protein [Candidatus Cloacimonadota bacterium]